MRYGLEWQSATPEYLIELFCLRADKRGDYEDGRLSSFDHYRNAVDLIFNCEESIRRHIWSDESIRMSTEFLGKREPKRFVGVAGNSSSGKSDDLGLFCIVMFLSDPLKTLCLLTSTTLEMAKLRVWKSVREYWGQVERFFPSMGEPVPGKAVHSKGRIRGMEHSGEYSDASGLVLVAADKQKGEEATSKVMGAKAPGDDDNTLLILGADELPDLSPNLLTVAYTNLINNPMFWMFGLGNPNLKLDPHGRFCEPMDGWDSVQHKPLEWKTERGKVIRIDAEHSSRIREENSWPPEDRENRKTKFFWQPSREVIDAAAKQYGRTSRFFSRMYDAMWSNSKAPNAIYSENELMRAAQSSPPEWDSKKELVYISGLDSSFTSGGDRSISCDAVCGKVNGIKRFHVEGFTLIDIDSKAITDIAPSHQVVKAWMKHCVSRNVRARAAGFDNSGSGVAFGDIVDMEWSPDVRKINFGGAPSDRIHRLDGVSKEEFGNRVSELWVQPKEYIRGDRDSEGEFHTQITGLTPEVIEELVSRLYIDQGAKLKIEPKKVMKQRTSKSPDLADAFVIALDMAIQNGWLDSEEEKQILRRARRSWKDGKRKIRIKMSGGTDLRFG